jgi:hypothetical protein
MHIDSRAIKSLPNFLEINVKAIEEVKAWFYSPSIIME